MLRAIGARVQAIRTPGLAHKNKARSTSSLVERALNAELFLATGFPPSEGKCSVCLLIEHTALSVNTEIGGGCRARALDKEGADEPRGESALGSSARGDRPRNRPLASYSRKAYTVNMLGKNAPAPIMRAPHPLEITEIFHTIQGEGPLSGMPTVFVRLAGCNLRCVFCDTEFDTKEVLEVQEVVERVVSLGCPSPYVVLTGGEPLRQHVAPLVRALNAQGLLVQVETAGTVFDASLVPLFRDRSESVSLTENMIVCSPKTGALNPLIHTKISVLKYIVRSGTNCIMDGLPTRSILLPTLMQNSRVIRPESIKGHPFPKTSILVQPEDSSDVLEKQRNLAAAVSICQRYGYRLSFQVHKAIAMP